MRLIHTADIHLGNGRFGGPDQRREDLRRILLDFGLAAEDNKADLAIIAGDLFDSRHPSAKDWAVATECISRLATKCHVVITDGNHDGAMVIGDDGTRVLRALAQTDWSHDVHVSLKPAVLDLYKAIVVTVPYPHKRLLDADPDVKAADPLDRMELIASIMDEGIRAEYQMALSLQERRVENGEDAPPIILVAHLTAAGATVGSERGMRLEDDIIISQEVLDLFDYCALGHIHKRQQVSRKAWYPGSPAYISWNEAGHDKSFNVVDVEAGADPVVRYIPSGDYRMFDWDGLPAHDRIKQVKGGLVRVSGVSPDAVRDTKAVLYAEGARYVEVVPAKQEAVVTSDRAIDTATGPYQALDNWLLVHQPDLDVAARRDHIEAAREIMEAS